jgi:hypothetical protein
MNMHDEFDDLFDDAGELALPTMRGSANLDVEDYQGYDGDSAILDDELQEDIPSRPGSGAASATDIDGTHDFDMLEVEGGMDAPGMKQTTFGDHPWGPGSSSGYRPYSQQRTGMDLRALGADNEHPAPRPMEKDSMHDEPEVIDTVEVGEVGPWNQQWHGDRVQQPSNAQIDPMTLYDRSSYEYEDSSQDTIGNGIFSMEEGVTWRPRDGMFANQFAVPAYLADEDELGVQQSEMWDSTADEWRVTQPSASGVTLARRVGGLKPAFTPFSEGGGQLGKSPPQMRPEVTGPRSHIEAFGRKAARALISEARTRRPASRGAFLKAALDSLGPGGATKAKLAADRLIKMGYRQDVAFEDAAAHLVMHAASRDLAERKGPRSQLPRLDKMGRQIRTSAPALRKAAAAHLMPLTQDNGALRKDLGALYGSPAGRGMGDVVNGNGESAPETPVAAEETKLLTSRNVMIAGGVGLGAYFIWMNRKAIAKNVKKNVKKLVK